MQRSIDVPLQQQPLQASARFPLAVSQNAALEAGGADAGVVVGAGVGPGSVTPRLDLNRVQQLRGLTQTAAASGRRPPLDSNQLPELVELLRHPASEVRVHSALFLQHLFFEQEATKAKFVALEGVRYLLELLRTSSSRPLVNAALGALRNLSSTNNDEIKVRVPTHLAAFRIDYNICIFVGNKLRVYGEIQAIGKRLRYLNA